MRILALSAFYPPDVVGGYEWAAYEVLTRLAARGHAVQVLAGIPQEPCPATPSVTRSLQRILGDGASLAQKWSVFRAYLHNYRQVAESIASFAPDILYYWGGGGLTPAILAAGEASGCPVALHLEDYWVPEMMRQTGGTSVLARISQTARKCFTSLPSYPLQDWGWVFVSDALRAEYAKRGIAGVDSIVAHNALPALPDTKVWPDARPKRLRVGYCGRFRPNKGVEELLHAVGKMATDSTQPFDLCLWGTGDAAYVEQLQALASEVCPAVSVCWKGSVPRETMPDVYRSLDLLVVPSQWDEPFGLVSIEALGAGVPVLATRSGALPEIVTDACGWIVEKDADALADGVQHALADYAVLRQRGENGRRRVQESFLWDDKIDAIETYLQARIQAT